AVSDPRSIHRGRWTNVAGDFHTNREPVLSLLFSDAKIEGRGADVHLGQQHLLPAPVRADDPAHRIQAGSGFVREPELGAATVSREALPNRPDGRRDDAATRV